MNRIILSCFAAVIAGCVSAKDLSVEDIPSEKIKKVLPKEWSLASVTPANTVSGWNKLSGSKGIRITISRTPYDNKLHKTKSGELAVHIPKLRLYVFPSNFAGKHVNTSAVFRDGKITKAESALAASRAVLVMEKFIAIGDWYVFHNNPSFRDWNTPVTDLTNKMKRSP